MAKADLPKEKTGFSPRFWWGCRLAVLLFGLLVYRETLAPGRVLFTTDDNVGALSLRKASLPDAFLGGWDDSLAAGQPNLVTISWTNLVLWLLPVKVFVNWIHTLDLVLASLLLLGFLRRRGLHPAAALAAVLTAFWLGSNFFLTYAGHIGKFGVLLMAALYLYLLELAVQRRSWAWAALAGGALGGMFLEQADSALFFALFLGPYAIVRAGEVFQWKPAGWIRIVVPVAGFSALVGLHAVLTAYTLFRMDLPETGQAADEQAARQELWEYCTQWSLPPFETLEWIAPGYFGWRSGEPTGPYWGKLGRSAGFETTGQGFPNFKLETFYKGAIPVLLCLFGAGLFFLKGVTTPLGRIEGRFWVVAVAVSFLLGLGKYFPLYALFFQLPGMSSIRNPVKFLQFTQLGMAILAGVGLDALLRAAALSASDAPALRRWIRLSGRMAAGLAGVMVLLGLMYLATRQGTVSRFAQEGYGTLAEVIAGLRIRAVFWAAAMTAGGLGLAAWLLRSGRKSLLPALALVAVVAADQLLHSRHYVSTVSARSLVGEQPPVEFIRENLGHQRLLLLNQQGFYNNWLTVLLPYNQIPTFNIAQMRMPEDYKAYFGAVGNQPVRMWAHFAVGLAMGPAQFWNQIQADPRMKDLFSLVYAFSIHPFGEGIRAEPATQSQPGHEVILQPRLPWYRYRLFNRVVTAPEGGLLDALVRADPMQEVVVPESVRGLPAPETAGRNPGEVGVIDYRAGRVHLKVHAETDAILRLADKFSPHWKATLDGKPATLFRCDYLFQGIAVPAGIRDVVVEFRPPLGGLWLQLAGFAGLAAAVGCLSITRRKPDPETA